ncbi:glycosyltransferase [Thermomonas sp.]
MAQRTRVLHSLFRVGSGGVEQTRLMLARHLDRDRYEQKLICLDHFGALPEQFSAAGCSVEAIGTGFSIFHAAGYRDALRVIRDWRPDIIHGAVYEGLAIAAVAGRLGRVPVVLGEETSDPVDRSLAGHALYRLFAGMTHHMVAVSPAVRHYLTRTIALPAAKVTLVNNGAEAPTPEVAGRVEAIRAQFGITTDSFVIGTVGRLLDSHKRVSDLIRAMPALAEGCADPRLLVVGDGEDSQMLRELAESLGVSARVHFCGYQPDPSDWYRVMDVFALASAHEAFGLVLVEAMLLGLPVVATRVGGIPSVVEEDVTAILVPPLSPAALAAALVALQRDPALRRSMGNSGSARAQAEFSARRYVDDIDALYTRCLSRQAMR